MKKNFIRKNPDIQKIKIDLQDEYIRQGGEYPEDFVLGMTWLEEELYRKRRECLLDNIPEHIIICNLRKQMNILQDELRQTRVKLEKSRNRIKAFEHLSKRKLEEYNKDRYVAGLLDKNEKYLKNFQLAVSRMLSGYSIDEVAAKFRKDMCIDNK